MYQVFPPWCTDWPRRSLSDTARLWRRLGVTWRSTSCYRRTKARRTEALHPATLICVGSRVTAFLGDDINGNEIQRHTGWLLLLFSTPPSRYLLLRRVLECGTNRPTQEIPSRYKHYVYPRRDKQNVTINFANWEDGEVGNNDSKQYRLSVRKSTAGIYSIRHAQGVRY